jgi:hexosaminidase
VSPAHLTRAQVRDLRALARRQHVIVVPEIDMPGHLTAALAVHPELQLKDAAGHREAGVLDVSNPAARRFARDLVEEELDLFPGPFVHLGADEVLPFATYPLGRYPSLEAYVKARYGPTANATDAVHGFVNDMDAVVRARGRTLRMWHDDVGGGSAVARNADIVAEWWIDVSPLSDVHPPTPQELLDQGHEILNAGWFPTYVVNGVGGSPVPIRPNLTTAYEVWDPHQFYGILVADANLRQPPALVARDEPRNRGSVLHLWNDNPTLTTETADAVTIAPALRALAQATWESPKLVASYASFLPIAARLGHAPGWTLAP